MTTVCCPHCFARYRAPVDRLGPGGARIRCPGCERTFDWVPRAPIQAAVAGVEPVASAVTEAVAAGAGPRTLARVVVEELANARGPELVAAWGEGRLFARCGVVLAVAFGQYLASGGAGAGAAEFRTALRVRLGIDLPEWREDA